MANKKNIETNKKSNELEQKKATQKKKLRLHSHLKVNIPLFQSLIMILPSLAKHASAEGVDNYSNEANRATENSVAEKDVTDDHGKANSSAVTHQESPTSENHVGSTLSVSHAPHGSNSHLVPSHHLSTFSHPQVHYIPSISMPTISLESNGQPTHSNNTPPTTPASPVTFVSEVIKGEYGELHVDANGQYTFVLNPNSPQYILLNQNKHGTDHFVLNLSDGSKIVVQIPVTGKQDTPTISGDLAGVVTEDHKVDSHGLLHANGKIDVIDPDQNESSMKPEVLAGKYGSLSIDADGHWQYHVDNSLSNIQALTSATSLHESFVIHTQDGTPQTLDMTIGGNDDNAVVTGIDTGVVTEDVTTQIQGQLTVNDSDLGENHFQASQINGHLGTLTITKDGAWTYALDNSNPAVQRLAQGSTATDIITVHSADGTAHQVTVTITGTGDAATIGGVDTGSIIENTAGVNMSPDYAQPGIATLGNTTLYADGKLTITDPDVGESGFERQGSNGYDYHGTYGDLILLTDGTWHYHADAGHLSGIGARPTTRGTAIDQLGEGQSLTDTITVHSKDGTTHDIVITIHGSNDRPYCSSEVVLQSGCEDTRQTLTTAQLLANTVDVDANDAGKLTIENLHVDHGSILNNADGTFTFTPEKDYNGDVHFSYDVKDAHGGMTHTGATTNLAAVNDTPDVTPLTDSVSEGADNHHTLNLLVGATDKDGDALSVSQLEYAIDGQPQAGKIPAGITLDTDGHTLIVDATNPAFNHLANGQSQQIAITYQVEDGHGGSTQQTATLTIAGTDDKATLVSNVIQLTETQALDSEFKSYRGQLQLIDPDSGDNTQFVFSGKYLGQGFAPGYLDVWPNGTYQFKLDAGTNRHADELIGSLHAGESKEFPYEVETSDGQKLTIMVKVTGEDNQAKIEVTPYSSLNNHVYEDHTSFGNTTHQLSSGGTLQVIDPDHDQAGFIAQTITTAEGGRFNINAHGHWSYNIDNDKVQHLGAGESFQQTFTVESIDGSAKKDITVTVHGTNDAPVASAEVRLANGLEDNKIVLTPALLLANTTDIDDNDIGKLSIENLQADHGAIALNTDGTFTFTPEKDYNGDVHFSYDVKDAHGGMTHTGANTTLAAVQDNAVIAGIDIGSVTEDLNPHASVQGNYAYKLEAQGSLSAIDPDKDESGFDFKTLISAAMHPEWRPYSSSLGGQLEIDPKGNWNYYIDNRKPEIQHLGKGETLTDTVTVHSKDGTTHDIVITIHGTNDAPTVSSEVQLNSGKEDSVQTITAADLLAHATDIDNNDQGQLTVANLIANHGSIRDNQDGTYTFTPEKDYNGVVQFNYDVIDRHGGITHTGATINLVAVNDASVLASELSSNEVIEDHLSGSSTHTLTSYWKNLDITDTDGQTDAQIVKIEVNGVEHNVPANFAITLQGAHGSFVTTHGVDGHNKWRYVADNNHTEIQQLKDGQSLTDHMTLITADGTRIPITATIIGTEDHVIIDTPDSLTASIGTAIEDKKNSLSGTLQAHDVDKDDSVYFQTQNLTGNFGSFSVDKDGTWHYQLDATKAQHLTAGQNQAEGFDIVAISSDGSKATHHIQINVQGSNDSAIIAGVDTGSVIENSAGVDMSPDYAHSGIATLGNTTLYADGKLTITDPDVGESGFERQGSNGYDYHGTYGDLILLTDGTWHYHADAGHLSGIGARPTTRGTAIDQLGEGQSLTDTITVHSKDGTTHDIVITIHGSNDRPYCSSEVVLANGSEDTRQTLTTAQLLANTVDVDANDAGKLTIENLHADHGSILNNADGTFTFTPEKDYNGDVHFSYDVKDAHGGVTHTGATTNLAAVNDNPDVTPLTDSVSEGADNHHTLNLLVGATDKEGDALTISHLEYAIDGQPQAGKIPAGITLDTDGHTLIVDATDPAFNHLANGQSQQIDITYQVEDGHGGSTQQSATLTIAGTDDKATLVSNVIQLTETQALDSEFKSYRGQLQLIDPDSGDNTQFVFSGKYLGQGFEPGHLDVWPNGTYQFKLDAGTNRHADELIGSLHAGESKEFPYEVETSDGQKLTIMVKVTGEDNQAKIAVTPYSSLNNHVYEDHTSFGNTTNQLSSGGTLQVIDPDHDQAGFIAQTITTAEGSRFNINAQGHWSYDIDNDKVQHLGAGESFQQTFTVESIDGSAKKDITVTVHGTNDAPVASAEVRLANGLEDTQIVLTPAQLLANSSDVDDNDIGKLSIENLQADHGAIALNTDGTFTFTPEKDYNGDVHFSYDVKDAHGGVTHTGASTTLSAVGDAAIFAGDKSGQITEDRHVQGDAQHTIFVTGVLNVIDPDAGEDHFYDTRNAHALSDPYGGHLTIGKAGDWAYSVPNANIQHLAAGQVEQVQYEVTTAGGDKQVITLYVHGTNDKPIISEVIAGAHNIDEDAANATSGQIIISDVDHSDQHAVSIDSQHPPQYGSVSYNNNSQTWVYTLNNNNAKVNALNDGDKLTDKFSILVDDGHGGVTQQEIEMSINGHSDIPPMPTLVAPAQISGSAGHQDLHASIGFPPIIHQGTPTPMTGWGISDHHGHSLTALHGQFGTLHVNPATGELSYDYQQPSSGVVKTHTGGSYGNGTDETDSFVLTLGGNQNSQVAVHLHSQSVHGNSGHHIDQTTLTGMDIAPINSPAPAATVQHDEPDVQEATTDEFSVDIIIDDDSVSSYLSEDTNEEIQGEHADSSSVTGAVAYLDALGINPTQQLTGNDEQHSPADMDLVWAQSEQATLVDEHGIHIDVSDALSDQDHQQSDHHSRDHDENYGDQQHQIDNLPEIDPNS